jgi:hypothetical protein
MHHFARDHVASVVLQVGGHCVGLFDQGPATTIAAGRAGWSWYVAYLIVLAGLTLSVHRGVLRFGVRAHEFGGHA